MTFDTHSSVVHVPRLPLQPESTHEVLMHLARVGAKSTAELLRQQRLDEEAEKFSEGRRFKQRHA